MVLLKRVLDNRFNEHNSPTVPRAPRSIRRRSNHKSPQTGGICAFELLAAVAGKLLEESECSSASSSAAVGFDQCRTDKDSIKKEQQDGDKPLGGENDDQGSSEGSVFFSGLQRDVCKGKLETVGEATGAEHASPFVSSACSMKLDFDSKSVVHKNPCEFVKLSGIKEESPPKCGETVDASVEKSNIKNPILSGETSGDCTMTNKSPASTNCKENVELSLFRDSNPNATFHKLGNNVNIGCKDDDESVSLDSQPNRKVKVYNSKSHTGDQNMRKLLTSNLWSTAPKLKDYEKCDTGGAVKHTNHNKRYPYEMDRSQRNSPFKKRRFLDRSSVVTYDGGISCESVSNSPEKSIEIEKNASSWKLHEGKGISSSAFGHQKTCNPKSSDVRLRIESFKVPELFIEVPKSTTVCSLKKTVLEAVTSILGGGLRVGVLLHGKNIQDDDKTLFQTGISQNHNEDSVAFMLEPDSATQPSQLICSEDLPVPLSPDSPKFVNRSLDNTNEDMFLSDKLVNKKTLMTDSKRPDGSHGDILPSQSADVAEKIGSDSKALVPVHEANTETLALMPVNPRPKRCEIGQRRARRPFSVSEVEALVQAVEKLGTGRWRDVKLCAFENAKHRTYVDLKDKWKTLVHTARISPQQRRGEPVPQELLDRVLAAQAYWSDHQAKQHGKQQHAIVPKLTNCTTIKA